MHDPAHELLDLAMMLELVADDMEQFELPSVQLIADDLSLLGLRLKELAMDIGNALVKPAESTVP